MFPIDTGGVRRFGNRVPHAIAIYREHFKSIVKIADCVWLIADVVSSYARRPEETLDGIDDSPNIAIGHGAMDRQA